MDNQDTTVMKVKLRVKESLEELKVHPRESLSDVVEKLVIHFKDSGGELPLLAE